jgi:hypothetical protein
LPDYTRPLTLRAIAEHINTPTTEYADRLKLLQLFLSKEIELTRDHLGIMGADTEGPPVKEDKGTVELNTDNTITIKQLPGIIRLKNNNGEIVNNISGNILDVIEDTSAGNILLMNKTHTKSYDGDYEFTLNRDGTISLTVRTFFDEAKGAEFLEFNANDTYNRFRKSPSRLELVPNSNNQEIYYYSCLLRRSNGRPYLLYRFIPREARTRYSEGRRVEYEKK